jgi:hypothetical protein
MARGKHAAGKPTRTHTPGLRIPPRDNEAAEAVLTSYRLESARVDDFTTEAEAEAWKDRLKRVVNWLVRHEIEPATGAKYDLRIRPKVYPCWQVDGDAVYQANEVDPDNLAQMEEGGHTVVQFWRVDYWAQPPQDRGFRKSGPDVIREAVTNSTSARGVAPPDTDSMPAQHQDPVPAPARRSVLYRRASLRLVRAVPAWSLITLDEAPGRDVRGLRRFCRLNNKLCCERLQWLWCEKQPNMLSMPEQRRGWVQGQRGG